MTMEEWNPVPSQPGYEASDHGRVRNAANGRVRKLGVNVKSGHAVVGFTGGKTRYVHHLVLDAFGVERPDGAEVRHLDGVPVNNRLDNLHWDTRSENTFDRRRHGVDPQVNKTHCPRQHRLEGSNLVAAKLAKGWRECRACANARATAYYSKQQGDAFDPAAHADTLYARYMEV